MRNNWKKVKLGDVANLQNGFAFKSIDFTQKGIKIIKIKNIASGKLNLDELSFYSGDSEKLKQFLIRDGDILISMTGSHISQLSSAVAKVTRYDFLEPALINQRVGRIYPKDNLVDNNFLYYLLSQPYVQFFWGSNAGGSANQANISPEIIKRFEFNLPPKSTQQIIGNVLNSFDSKIKILENENKTLESLGQLLFKRWFVDFEFPNEEGNPYKSSGGKMIESDIGLIPNLWKTGKLVDFDAKVTDFVANGSFASLKENVTLYNEKNFALFLRNTDLKSNFKEKTYVDEHSYNFLKKTQLHGGEIIISNVGDIGSVYLCPYLDLHMVLGNNTISLTSKFQSYFYTLFTNKIGKKMIESITGGSAQPKFNKTDFRNLQLLRPTDTILIRFEMAIWGIYKKILQNTQDSLMLGEVRDYLLPKLMKGEIYL